MAAARVAQLLQKRRRVILSQLLVPRTLASAAPTGSRLAHGMAGTDWPLEGCQADEASRRCPPLCLARKSFNGRGRAVLCSNKASIDDAVCLQSRCEKLCRPRWEQRQLEQTR